MESVSLPFYRSSQILPGPLPTKDGIHNATIELPSLRDLRYGRVVVVRNDFVVKHGQFVPENEGHALLYVEKHLDIPAPRLYAMYREEKELYLIMQHMPGRDLKHLWADLSEDNKVSIATELRTVLDKMRSVPSPGFFGSVTRGPLSHRFFLSVTQDPRITGPFDTERDLNIALASRAQSIWDRANMRGWASEFLARNLPETLKGHECVFTHAELLPQNIVVRETAGVTDKERRFAVSAIVDWATAGWYPSYWEYASAFADFSWVDDWPEKFELVVKPQPLEAAMIKFLRQVIDY